MKLTEFSASLYQKEVLTNIMLNFVLKMLMEI